LLEYVVVPSSHLALGLCRQAGTLLVGMVLLMFYRSNAIFNKEFLT